MPAFMYVVAYVLFLGFSLVSFIVIPVLICCVESAEEVAAAERRARAARAAEDALALGQPRPAEPAPVELMTPVEPVEVELMRPVVPAAAAPPVAKLVYFPYSAEGRSASEKLDCPICLEVFEHGATCSEVPACQHLFHRDCIGVWMKTNTTCPLCRRNIVAGSERLSAAEDMV